MNAVKVSQHYLRLWQRFIMKPKLHPIDLAGITMLCRFYWRQNKNFITLLYTKRCDKNVIYFRPLVCMKNDLDSNHSRSAGFSTACYGVVNKSEFKIESFCKLCLWIK